MHSAVEFPARRDLTSIPVIVQGAAKLGLLEALLVLIVSLISRVLPLGPLQTVLLTIVIFAGIAIVTYLPGVWTRPATIEGIAGAAGIGLAAAWVFLLVDVTLLQNIGTYSDRWLQIGGGSDWWYHPVWWMVGTFLPWFGAWMLANQRAVRGERSVAAAFGTALIATVIVAVIAVLIHFPGAAWTLPTFAVAYLPGLVLATLVSGLSTNRG